MVSAVHPFLVAMEVAAAALRDGWRAGRTAPVSCLSIHWLIDWLQGAVLLQERATPSPLGDERLVPYFGLPNQMSDSPLCLCRAETNVHAGTSAACANKDLNTEQTAPPSPLCACDHQIIAERGRADLQVWGMGPAFSCWDLPSGLNSTSPPSRVPFFPVIVS